MVFRLGTTGPMIRRLAPKKDPIVSKETLAPNERVALLQHLLIGASMYAETVAQSVVGSSQPVRTQSRQWVWGPVSRVEPGVVASLLNQ